MKKSLALFYIGFLMCTSCNIKQPLKNVLAEANQKPTNCLRLDSAVDTISLERLFPSLNSVDSVTSKELKIKPLNKEMNSFIVEVGDTSKTLHEAVFHKDGNTVTAMVLYDNSDSELLQNNKLITSKGMLNKRLLFEYKNRPPELYVLWQNVVLPSQFISFGKNNISVLIPKETRQLKESYIRIFGVNGNNLVMDLRVPLIYGIPVPED